MWTRLRQHLSEPVDAASLAAFRVLFGLLMCGAALRFLAKGWVNELLLAPSFHFTYPGFEFVKPLPALAMHLHYVLLALLALALAAGFAYRFVSVAFLIGFTYVELIDQAIYLNHYYFVSLLAAMLCVLPLGRVYGIDGLLARERRLTQVPRYMLYALRLQVGVVYFFAGVAKLNSDWLFEAQPLRLWLPARSDLPLLGPWLELPEIAYAASWFGAAFDLGIVFLLLAKRTRALAFALLVGFHVATGVLFPIGIFPWLMTAAATVLLSPSWPRRFVRRWLPESTPSANEYQTPRWVLPLLAAHCVVQLTLPLRQFLHRDPSWTLEGFNFSWNVMVVEKSGAVTFRTRDERSGETSEVEPRTFLKRFQEVALAQDPALVRDAARWIAAQNHSRGREVAVYADAVASLNGRPAQPLIDPNVDLTCDELPASWIVPLEKRPSVVTKLGLAR